MKGEPVKKERRAIEKVDCIYCNKPIARNQYARHVEAKHRGQNEAGSLVAYTRNLDAQAKNGYFDEQVHTEAKLEVSQGVWKLQVKAVDGVLKMSCLSYAAFDGGVTQGNLPFANAEELGQLAKLAEQASDLLLANGIKHGRRYNFDIVPFCKAINGKESEYDDERWEET